MNLKGIRIRAVAAGLLTDIAGAGLIGVAAPLSLLIARSSGHTSTAEHIAVLWSSVGATLLMLCGTTFFTGLGGYVAAQLSHPHGVTNALAVGILSLVIDAALVIVLPPGPPVWKQVLCSLPTIPAVFAGGRLAARPCH